MNKAIVVGAESRKDQGKGASRRLRHAGKVPAILYGGKGEPSNIAMDQLKLLNVIGDERFYSSLVTLQLDGKDLQRVLADQAIRIHLPIHFINETTCPGVKTEGGQVSHLKTDVEISCLPKDLPEALVVDMGAMHLNDTIFLKDIKVPAGVTIPELATGRDIPVVSIHAPRAEEPEPVAAEAAAAAATPAAGDAKAPAAGDAKAAPAAEAKKEGGKK